MISAVGRLERKCYLIWNLTRSAGPGKPSCNQKVNPRAASGCGPKMDHEPAGSNWVKEQVPGTYHGESAEQTASAPGKGVGAAKYVASVDEEGSARITSPQFQSCKVDSNFNGGILMKILAGERDPSEPYVFSCRCL